MSERAAVTIRLAGPPDIPAITAIYNDAILTTTATFDIEPKSIDDRREWLAGRSHRHPVVVADLDSGVVGWGSLTRWSPRAAYDRTAETAIYVDAAFRGRGIGGMLLQGLMRMARDLGYRVLIAQATTESAASIHLHRQAGFASVGTLEAVGEKFGRLLDVMILQKRLD